MFGAKNIMVEANGAKMPCAVFGKGSKNIILLPGVGDGLTTVEGKAVFLGLMYRNLIKDYRVYVFSRRKPLPEGFGTAEMAEDLSAAMDSLGIKKASVIGVSMGGMIAQHLAAKFPEKMEKLVLVVTAAKKTPEMEILNEWLRMAEKGDGVALMDSSVYNMYSDSYYKKNRWLTGITGRFAVPKSYERFIRMSTACLEHDASAVLCNIKAPTLVIGGGMDRTVGIEASRELADKIPGAKLYVYENLRHALYDEVPDFMDMVAEFIG